MSINEEPEMSERVMRVLGKDTERTEWVMDLRGSSIRDTNSMGPNTLGQLILLRELNLNFGACTALSDVKAVGNGISQLKSLRELNLDCWGCTALTDVKAVGHGISQLKLLQQLNLSFGYCKVLTDVKAVGNGISQLKLLQQLTLNLDIVKRWPM